MVLPGTQWAQVRSSSKQPQRGANLAVEQLEDRRMLSLIGVVASFNCPLGPTTPRAL